MGIEFTKMHGLGNDFMVIDATTQIVDLSSEQIRKLADRHRGVGFDQLLMLSTSSTEKADFTYRIYNNDGTEAEQCGNGARCMARFIHQKGLSDKKELSLVTQGRITRVILESDDQVMVEMGSPYFEPERIPFVEPQSMPPYSLKIDHQDINFSVVGMGNPHAVIIVDDIELAQVHDIGKSLSTHLNFPQGANVGFMQVINQHEVQLRVYERGAGETLACGSGACAAVAVGFQQGLLKENVRVVQAGGDLQISWTGPGAIMRMTGPAQFVYQGIYLSS